MTTPVRTTRSGPSRSLLGPLAVLVAGLLWGTSGTAASFLTDGVPTLAVGATAFVIGGVLLFATAPRGSWAVLRCAPRFPLVSSAVAVAVFPLGFYGSMQYAGVAVGTVVTVGSAPLFAAVLESLRSRSAPRALWFVAAALALTGLVLLVVVGAHPAGDSINAPLGVALGLVGGLSYAYYTVVSARIIATPFPARHVMGAVFGLGAIPLIPVAIVFAPALFDGWTNVAVLVYITAAPMVVAYLFFGAGLVATSGSAATIITLVEPVLAAVLAVTVVGESLTPLGWAGLVLILVAVAVTIRAPRPVRDTDVAQNAETFS